VLDVAGINGLAPSGIEILTRAAVLCGDDGSDERTTRSGRAAAPQSRFPRAANSYIRPCRYFQFSRTDDDFQRGLRRGVDIVWGAAKSRSRHTFILPLASEDGKPANAAARQKPSRAARTTSPDNQPYRVP
jgi:hypothetical protein